MLFPKTSCFTIFSFAFLVFDFRNSGFCFVLFISFRFCLFVLAAGAVALSLPESSSLYSSNCPLTWNDSRKASQESNYDKLKEIYKILKQLTNHLMTGETRGN